VDGLHRRVGRARPPARRRGAALGRSAADRAASVTHPAGELLRRSRGGPTPTPHLACDERGRILAIVLTPGQRHERAQFGPVLDAIRMPRPGGCGRPRKRPDHSIADNSYS